MQIDPLAIKRETAPYLAGTYFNNAGAALMSRAVVDATVAHLHRETAVGSYAAQAEAAEHLADLYAAAGELLGCAASEIALTSGNTGGWREAVGALRFSPGDRILVGRSEWGGNYAALEHIARRTGAVIEVVPCNEFGEIGVDQLANMLDSRVRLISVTWAPANGGLVNPVAAVGQLARAAGIPYFVDAAQVVGQLPVNVEHVGCDVLTAPGRKWLRGPRGTGLLYVRKTFLPHLVPWMVDTHTAPFNGQVYQLRDDTRRLEPSEVSLAAQLGLRIAIRAALELGVQSIGECIAERARIIRVSLGDIPGVTLHDLGRQHSGLVSFTVEGVPASKVKTLLASEGVQVASNGEAFTPLDMRARGLGDIVRASPHIYTTDEDIACLIQAVRRVAL